MTKTDPVARISTRQTHQQERTSGRTDEVKNSAGGYVFEATPWNRLRRFLVLGTTGGTYYIGERDLTRENVDTLARLVAADGQRVVREIVTVSTENLAPKVQPTIFALAYCAGADDPLVRAAALDALPQVCRTGYHLFTFVRYVENFRGWGRGLRRAVAGWYTDKDPDKLAYQLIKYRQRDGWSNRDLLRLTKPAVSDPELNALLGYAVGKPGEALHPQVRAAEMALTLTDPKQVAALVTEFDLPWEALPSEALQAPEVWEALLPKMGLTALIRNLGRMSSIGLVKPFSNAANVVIERLADQDALRKSRVHPFTVLLAQSTYAAGKGVKGKLTWNPVGPVVDALNEAFYLAFGNVQPAGKRTLIGLDVSGSMSGFGWNYYDRTPGGVAGTHLSPREAAAAMCMITVRTEPQVAVMAFSGGFVPLNISKTMRLDTVVRTTERLPFDRTDCSVPMRWAEKNGLDVDTFVIYTDNETWSGVVKPSQALVSYRQKTGHDARLAVVGMVSNGFTIADPTDPGMMDFVGFDGSAPQVLSDFSAGKI